MSRFSDFSNALKNISHRRTRFILLFLSGLLTGITLVIPQIGFIEWISLIPVGTVLLYRASAKEVRLRNLYGDGFVFFYTFYLVCYHWFTYLYPLDFIDGMTEGAALAVVIVSWFGLSLLQAVLSSFVFVIAGIICRGSLCTRFSLLKPFAIAGLWTLCEWSQTIGWWGVPWGRLPIGQTYYLTGLQNASLLGSYFVTFVIVAVNILFAYALVNIIEIAKLKIGVILAACILFFQYGSGAILYLTTDVTDGEKIRVACIQGNISSSEKWDINSSDKTLHNYEKYTVEAAKEGADIVLWPETAIPYNLTYNLDYAEYFAEMSKENEVYILVGTYVSDEQDNSLNSLVCFTPEGKQLDTVYSKRHLVPFGEYVPLRPIIETLIPPLAELVLSSDDIYPGEGAQIIETKEGIAIGGLICFDSIYDELTLESVREGAEIICLSTNDSWFIDSAALNIHNAHAQIRAIESGRYIARAANTGISTIITPTGEVIEQLDPLVEGKVISDVYATDRSTIWSVIGNVFVDVLILVYICIIADTVFFKIKDKRNP